jgi:hypothetical protein
VDPAGGRANGDFFALGIGSVDKASQTIYTRELTLARCPVTQQIAMIVNAYDKWRPLQIGIETNGYQITLKQYLDQESRKRGWYMPITELHTHTHKEMRIRAIAPLFERGDFRLPRDLDPEVERQFLQFPGAGRDDAPDVCAMGIDVARSLAHEPVGEILTSGRLVFAGRGAF